MIRKIAAAALAFVRDYRWSARLNILASFVVLLFALLLFRSRPPVDDLLLADDLMVGRDGGPGVLSQMVEVFHEVQTSVLAVQEVPLAHVKRYGIVAGDPVGDRSRRSYWTLWAAAGEIFCATYTHG